MLFKQIKAEDGTTYEINYENEDVIPLVGHTSSNYQIMPMVFYKATKKSDGKSHRLAAELLAYVYNWYLPKSVGSSANVKKFTQKFSGEKLFINYEKLADVFCASVRELRNAFSYLKQLDLAEIKYTYSPNGAVTWVKLNSLKVLEILKRENESHSLSYIGETVSPVEVRHVSPLKVRHDKEEKYLDNSMYNNISNYCGTVSDEQLPLDIFDEISDNVLAARDTSSEDFFGGKVYMANSENKTVGGELNSAAPLIDVNLMKVTAIKRKYPSAEGNRYVAGLDKKTSIPQFFKTCAHRLKQGKVTEAQLDSAFSNFTQKEHCGLADIFLALLKDNSKYKLHEALYDFGYIMCGGRVASPAREGKGAKKLAEWIEQDLTNFTEVEDCWIYMRDCGINYTLSLDSLLKALQSFSKYRVELPDGRYGWQKTPVDKSSVNSYNVLQAKIDEAYEKAVEQSVSQVVENKPVKAEVIPW